MARFLCLSKKLRAELGKRYSSIPPEKLTELVPNKEEMTIAKVHCHNGQDILIYCLHKNPIFFDVDGVVFPTGRSLLCLTNCNSIILHLDFIWQHYSSNTSFWLFKIDVLIHLMEAEEYKECQFIKLMI